MTIDTAAILAAQYRKNPVPLREAVLGQGQSSINPYAALRALQLQKEAERYQMAQAAMQGQQYQNQPSMVEQVLQGGQPQMPPQGMPPQGMPQPQMSQPQMPQQPQGLAGMPVPEQTYAPGGIVAFNGADRSDVQDDTLTSEMLNSLEDREESLGDPAVYSQMSAMLPRLVQQLGSQTYTPMTDPEFETAYTKRKQFLEKDTGPSPYAAFEQQLAEYDTERGQGLGQAKGLALLAAAGDVLQPGGAIRGLGAASKTYAGMVGQAITADKAEKRALMSMRFNLADAQRKETMGLNKEALAAADQARVDHNAAQRFKIDKLKALSTVVSAGARATKPTGAGAPKNFDALAARYVAADMFRNQQLPENQRQPKELVEEKAYERAARDWSKISAGELMGIKGGELRVKERDVTVGETRAATEQERLEEERNKQAIEQGKFVSEQMRKWETSREAIQSKKDGTYEEKKRQKEAELRSRMQKQSGAGNKNPQATPAGGKVVTRADIKATAEASGRTEDEVEKAARAKGYTIK